MYYNMTMEKFRTISQIRTKKSRAGYQLAFTLIFFYFALLRYWLIPSNDDYIWRGKIGNYLLHHWFYGPDAIYGGNSNGRFLGNLLEIFTMHHLAAAIIVFAGFWTLLIWGIWRLSGKNWGALVAASLFIFTLQAGFLNNILVWNAGFINYVPPIALMLAYLVIVQQGTCQQLSAYWGGVTFLIGFCGGLFLETLTITQIILGLIILGYQKGKSQFFHKTYLMGALAALLLMMTNPSYWHPTQYRQTTFNLGKIWTIYADHNHFWLLTNNLPLLIVVCLAILLLIYRCNYSPKMKLILGFTTALFLIYYLAINVYLKSRPLTYIYTYTKVANSIKVSDSLVSILFIIFIGIIIFLFFRSEPFLWLYYLLAGIAFGPLMFVLSPTHCRGIFPCYVFMYLIAVCFVQAAVAQAPVRKMVSGIFALWVLIGAGNYQYKMFTNYHANLQRVQQQSFLNGTKSLRQHVPYRKFVWANDMLNQQDPHYWQQVLKCKQNK